MAEDQKVCFFVVDGGRGRFLAGSRTPVGRAHVDELDSIELELEEHEHGRPSPRSGKSGNSYASGGHEDEHQIRRFAKQVAAWMETKVRELALDGVTVFSAPRFLGELRKVYPPALAGRIEERQSDLTQLSAGSLAKHPSVEELLSERGPAS